MTACWVTPSTCKLLMNIDTSVTLARFPCNLKWCLVSLLLESHILLSILFGRTACYDRHTIVLEVLMGSTRPRCQVLFANTILITRLYLLYNRIRLWTWWTRISLTNVWIHWVVMWILISVRILLHILLIKNMLVLLIYWIIAQCIRCKVICILLVPIWQIVIIQVISIVILGRHIWWQLQWICTSSWRMRLILKSHMSGTTMILRLRSLAYNWKSSSTLRRYVSLPFNHARGTRLIIDAKILHFTCCIIDIVHGFFILFYLK